MNEPINHDMLLLRLPEVERLTGLRKSAIYYLMAANLFPRPVRLGMRAVAWRQSELHAWQISRPRGGSFEPGGNEQ